MYILVRTHCVNVCRIEQALAAKCGYIEPRTWTYISNTMTNYYNKKILGMRTPDCIENQKSMHITS